LHSEAEANWTASRSQLEKQHSEQLVSMEQHHAFAIETLQKALDSLQIALQHCQSEKDVAQSDLKHKSIEVDEMRQLVYSFVLLYNCVFAHCIQMFFVFS
jgi:uncharacterized protein with von Willebrand factor type A (vWA) domain